jgi:hypothetical protein
MCVNNDKLFKFLRICPYTYEKKAVFRHVRKEEKHRYYLRRARPEANDNTVRKRSRKKKEHVPNATNTFSMITKTQTYLQIK